MTTVVRCLSTDYRPRRPQEGVVYQVVREHYETFRVEAAARCDGDPLPRFIDEEFRSFLCCGQGYSAFHQDFKERWRLQFAPSGVGGVCELLPMRRPFLQRSS